MSVRTGPGMIVFTRTVGPRASAKPTYLNSVQLFHLVRRLLMTNVTSSVASRTAEIAAHAYTLPVVRELPPKPIDAAGASGQW
jgi:hypothetical protein